MQINLTICLDISDSKIKSTYDECGIISDDKNHTHNATSIAAEFIVKNALNNIFKDNPDIRLICVVGDTQPTDVIDDTASESREV